MLCRAGAAEFVLARGHEARYARSRPVTLVPDISLAEVLAEIRRDPPRSTRQENAAAADAPLTHHARGDTQPTEAGTLLYHAGPMEAWGDGLGGKAGTLRRAVLVTPQFAALASWG